MGMKKFKMLNLICASCNLSSKEILVAQYFIYKSNRSGICYPAVETIANHCGVSIRTIQRATRKLQEEGFISIVKRYIKGKQTSNEYRLNTLLVEEMEREQEYNRYEQKEKDEILELKEVSLEEMFREVEEQFKQPKAEEKSTVRVAENEEKESVSRADQDLDYDLLDQKISYVTVEKNEDAQEDYLQQNNWTYIEKDKTVTL